MMKVIAEDGPCSHLCDLLAVCRGRRFTHRLRILAVVSRPVLGQPLLLLVKGTRLQDHLLQLEGGVAVEATLLQQGEAQAIIRRTNTHLHMGS